MCNVLNGNWLDTIGVMKNHSIFKNLYGQMKYEYNDLCKCLGKRWPCDQCEHEATSKYTLELHKKTLHEKKMRVPCLLCDKEFCNEYVMRRHIQSFHEGVRFQCEQCEYSSESKVSTKFSSFVGFFAID